MPLIGRYSTAKPDFFKSLYFCLKTHDLDSRTYPKNKLKIKPFDICEEGASNGNSLALKINLHYLTTDQCSGNIKTLNSIFIFFWDLRVRSNDSNMRGSSPDIHSHRLILPRIIQTTDAKHFVSDVHRNFSRKHWSLIFCFFVRETLGR